MPRRFLTYLRDERDRLRQFVADLASAGEVDGAAIARLRLLTQTVDQQIDWWASDLMP